MSSANSLFVERLLRAGIAASVVFLAGCDQHEEVSTYTVPSHESLQTKEFLKASAARKARPGNRQHIPVMRIRTRKFLGTIALLVLVVVWSLMGMTLAQTPWLAASGLYQAIFYVVAGLGWVLPAMPIISWMARPDA